MKTAQEILDIVESNMSVEKFAHSDYPVPETFIGSEELQVIKKNKLEALAAYQGHPTHKKGYNEQRDDSEYQNLRDVYIALPSYYDLEKAEWLESLGLGKVVVVDKYGGEDMGSTWYSVKHFVDHDVYIQTDGYYSSYEGTDFQDGYGYEVRPKEKMIIVYEAI